MSKHEIKSVDCGLVHFNNVVFFAKKNFKEKIDARIDKGPQGGAIKISVLEIDGEPKKATIEGEGHYLNLPITSIFSYTPRVEANKHPIISPTSNVSANPKITAQVSGPHDHVFAGMGAGQTGQAKIK